MKKRIVYVHPGFSSFVERDMRFLSEQYQLSVFVFRAKKKWMTPFVLLKQFFWLLFRLPGSKLSVIQFGGYHSMLPTRMGKLFGIPSLVVLGGTDCVSFPSIGYGNFSKKWLARATRYSYRHATHLSPVHDSLIYSDYHYQPADGKAQGCRVHCPGFKTPYTTIYNGYDGSRFTLPASPPSPASFVTVAILESHRTYFLKGIDLIVSAAAQMPEASFTIIGARPEAFPVALPSNITVKPFVPNHLLNAELGSHRFYLQLSMSEGFPNALCEAMLCGCTPVVSDVAAMPFIVGETGFVLKEKNEKLLVALLQTAIADKKERSQISRDRILENFTEEQRKKALLELCGGLERK